MSTFSLLQIVNETLRRRGRAHWWLQFHFPSSLVFYMNICLSVFVSVCFCLAIFITVFLPAYSFGLPCHFSVLYFVSLYPCTALSFTNEKMTDVGVGWEMEPVIYFWVFCRACLGPDSSRPQAMLPWGLLVHAEMAHTHVQYSVLHPYICTNGRHTHTHILLPPCCCHWQTDVCWCPREWESKQYSVIESLLPLCTSLRLSHCRNNCSQSISLLKGVCFVAAFACLSKYFFLSLYLALCLFPPSLLHLLQILYSFRGYFCQHPCGEAPFLSVYMCEWYGTHVSVGYLFWVKLFRSLCPFLCVWACAPLV